MINKHLMIGPKGNSELCFDGYFGDFSSTSAQDPYDTEASKT